MPTFKMNFLQCKGLPEPAALATLMDEFGFAPTEEIGVLEATSTPASVLGTLVRRTSLEYDALNDETREIETKTVEQAEIIAFAAFPDLNVLQVYTGGMRTAKIVGEFLASSLGLAVVALGIAVVGVYLNNHRLIGCFYLWFVSNGLSLALHLAAGMWTMTVRDAVFIALAVHGLRTWSRPKTPEIVVHKAIRHARTTPRTTHKPARRGLWWLSPERRRL